MKQLKDYVTEVPDFPTKGILFYDITTILNDPEGLRLAIDEMIACMEGVEFDAIAAVESRGFLFGMPIAYALGKPFIPIRKPGKLPRETISTSYELEYGDATIEVHKDDVAPGTRIVLVDDLIATGGTLQAAVELLEQLGAKVVEVVCLLELVDLHGRDRLPGYRVESIIPCKGA